MTLDKLLNVHLGYMMACNWVFIANTPPTSSNGNFVYLPIHAAHYIRGKDPYYEKSESIRDIGVILERFIHGGWS